MTIKVIIQRNFKEPPPPDIFKAINEIRVNAMQQKGYISGETLVDLSNNKMIVVLSVWSTLEDWNIWLNSKKRSELESYIEPYMDKPLKIYPLLSGVDGTGKVFCT